MSTESVHYPTESLFIAKQFNRILISFLFSYDIAHHGNFADEQINHHITLYCFGSQGWARDVKARDRDETETLTSRDRDETETRPRRWLHQPRRDRDETFVAFKT